LINDIRLASGKEEMPGLPPPDKPSPVPSSYLEYCKEHGCIFHRGTKADMHHYPHTRVRTDDDRKVVPLCRVCHTEFHNTPWSEWGGHTAVVDFLFKYILMEDK